mmetsp:Transcript_7233/g.11960  ORF Transcript_7233/g.11960 Transcript_7233/m.11960 type:complete len:213 (+) Transcript_7233:64-702(+)
MIKKQHRVLGVLFFRLREKRGEKRKKREGMQVSEGQAEGCQSGASSSAGQGRGWSPSPSQTSRGNQEGKSHWVAGKEEAGSCPEETGDTRDKCLRWGQACQRKEGHEGRWRGCKRQEGFSWPRKVHQCRERQRFPSWDSVRSCRSSGGPWRVQRNPLCPSCPLHKCGEEEARAQGQVEDSPSWARGRRWSCEACAAGELAEGEGPGQRCQGH